jgi:NAD(P)-dependent dehydrogenase (short-subunit alcohol dehydrogenase family)
MHVTSTEPKDKSARVFKTFNWLTLYSSFDEFAFHLHTNTIGPIITANRLLATTIPIGTIVFMSSDSGSQGNFREMEDGFAAYAASKAALNMAVRHLAAELKRKDDDTIILAMHPGEVATDMANVQLPWEVQGIISPEEVGKQGDSLRFPSFSIFADSNSRTSGDFFHINFYGITLVSWFPLTTMIIPPSPF